MILDNVMHILWNTEMQDDMIEASRQIDESIMGSIKSAVIREFDVRPLTSAEKGVSKVRVAIAKADLCRQIHSFR